MQDIKNFTIIYVTSIALMDLMYRLQHNFIMVCRRHQVNKYAHALVKLNIGINLSKNVFLSVLIILQVYVNHIQNVHGPIINGEAMSRFRIINPIIVKYLILRQKNVQNARIIMY